MAGRDPTPPRSPLRQRIVGETLADARGDIIRGCLPTSAIDNLAVWECDLDLLLLLLCQPLVALRLATVPDGDPGVQEIRGWIELRYLALLVLCGLFLGLRLKAQRMYGMYIELMSSIVLLMLKLKLIHTSNYKIRRLKLFIYTHSCTQGSKTQNNKI